jgi:hypothetical protein
MTRATTSNSVGEFPAEGRSARRSALSDAEGTQRLDLADVSNGVELFVPVGGVVQQRNRLVPPGGALERDASVLAGRRKLVGAGTAAVGSDGSKQDIGRVVEQPAAAQREAPGGRRRTAQRGAFELFGHRHRPRPVTGRQRHSHDVGRHGSEVA